MCQCGIVASTNVANFQLGIGIGNWQHFHIGNIQKASPIHRERVSAYDVRRVFDRDSGEVLPEAVGHLHVAEVIHEPQGDLGDLGWEWLDLDSVELRDADLAELRYSQTTQQIRHLLV